jgi:hypothetical protein
MPSVYSLVAIGSLHHWSFGIFSGSLSQLQYRAASYPKGSPSTPAYERVNAALTVQACTDPDQPGFATTLTMVATGL